MFRRIAYVLGLNFALLMTFNLILSLLPIPPGYYTQMLILYSLFGFGGAFISLLFSRSMAKRGKRVQVIDPQNPKNQTESWLVKCVHEYSRKAGLPKMPEVGIYPGQELNAFATGPSKSKSLVAVSEGLLTQMTKEEVEGVLGHEVAHIKNGDMVTMVLLQGTINTLVMFASRILADIVASNLSRNNERGSYWMRFALYQVFAMVLGVLGMVVTGTFSRKREFRADEGGARLAGLNSMISSLEKLQMAYNPKMQASQNKEQAAFASLQISGLFRNNKLAQLMSTHPPLEKRIRALKQRSL